MATIGNIALNDSFGVPIVAPPPGQEFIPGGSRSLVDLDPVRGMYAVYPAQFPKYHPGTGRDSVTQQARLFVLVEDVDAYSEYVARAAERHPRAKKIVETLAVTSPSSGGAGGYGYVDILIQSVQYSETEFVQVHEVFADTHSTYFFGKQAPSLQISGTLINSQQDDWADAFAVLYDAVIRGTRLAQDNRLLAIRIDSRLYFCTPTGMGESRNASNEIAVAFNLSLSVKRMVLLNTVRQHQVPTNLRAYGGEPVLSDVTNTGEIQDGLTQIATRKIYAYSQVGRAVITEAPTLVQQALESDAGRRLAYVARKQSEQVTALGNAIYNAVTGEMTPVDGSPQAAALAPISKIKELLRSGPSTAPAPAQPPPGLSSTDAANQAALQSVFGAPTHVQGKPNGGRTSVSALTTSDY
jgi:hypothetical protein